MALVYDRSQRAAVDRFDVRVDGWSYAVEYVPATQVVRAKLDGRLVHVDRWYPTEDPRDTAGPAPGFTELRGDAPEYILAALRERAQADTYGPARLYGETWRHPFRYAGRAFGRHDVRELGAYHEARDDTEPTIAILRIASPRLAGDSGERQETAVVCAWGPDRSAEGYVNGYAHVGYSMEQLFRMFIGPHERALIESAVPPYFR